MECEICRAWWIGRLFNVRGYSQLHDTVRALAWRERRKPREISIGMSSLWYEIRNQDFPNTTQNSNHFFTCSLRNSAREIDVICACVSARLCVCVLRTDSYRVVQVACVAVLTSGGISPNAEIFHSAPLSNCVQRVTYTHIPPIWLFFIQLHGVYIPLFSLYGTACS
jgi:hypothetical protein